MVFTCIFISVDCVGVWNDGPCSKRCKPGYLTRTYQIVIEAQHGGRQCPYETGKTETKTCLNFDKCIQAKPQSKILIQRI